MACYFHDILVHSPDIKYYLCHVQQVLDQLGKSAMRTNWKKYSLFQMEIEFVGHKISGDGMLPQSSKIEQIVEFSKPTNSNQLCAFLGLAACYRKFIRNYLSVVEPYLHFYAKARVLIGVTVVRMHLCQQRIC